MINDDSLARPWKVLFQNMLPAKRFLDASHKYELSRLALKPGIGTGHSMAIIYPKLSEDRLRILKRVVSVDEHERWLSKIHLLEEIGQFGVDSRSFMFLSHDTAVEPDLPLI
jgi:hypothetical protein